MCNVCHQLTLAAYELDEFKPKRSRNKKKGFQKGNTLWKNQKRWARGQENAPQLDSVEDTAPVESLETIAEEIIAPPDVFVQSVALPPLFPGSLPQHGFTYAVPPPFAYPDMIVLASLPVEPEVDKPKPIYASPFEMDEFGIVR